MRRFKLFIHYLVVFIRHSITIELKTNIHHAIFHNLTPCIERNSGDKGNTIWNGGCGVTCSSPVKSSGPLGEALCHSQTRAREAEKRAERSFQEYKKISHLFLREASLSLTYRQKLLMPVSHQFALKCRIHFW